MKKKKTWKEKLHESKDLPKVEAITEEMSRRWGRGTVAIPSPLEIDEMMRRVPPGSVTTINEIREAIARRHRADIGCPFTTGIFAWIAAHAADEARQEGAADITPYWRVLKAGGEVNEKYPGGIESQKALLDGEGHIIVKKGKRHLVENIEKALYRY